MDEGGLQSEWASKVLPSTVASLEPKEVKRQLAIFELIETEKLYVEDMQLLRELYMDPISKQHAISADEIELLFSSLGQIINLASAFCEELQRIQTKRGYVVNDIGAIIEKNLRGLETPYATFCGHRMEAFELLQSLSNSFGSTFNSIANAAAQDPRSKGMPLISFLMKPMQRVTKYPLLVTKILHYTPSHHPDSRLIASAHFVAEEVALAINEGVRKTEGSRRMRVLENCISGLPSYLSLEQETKHLGSRGILYEGKVSKAKDGKRSYIFVFNDVLLICRLSNSSLSSTSSKHTSVSSTSSHHLDEQYILKERPLPMNEIIARDAVSEGKDKKVKLFDPSIADRAFQICHIHTVHTFVASSIEAKTNWIKNINAGVEKYFEQEKQIRSGGRNRRAVSSTAHLGTVSLTVIEVCKLAKSNSKCYCVVRCNDQQLKSKLSRDTTTPKWYYEAIFFVHDLTDVINVSVYEQAQFSKDVLIGEVFLNLQDLINEGCDLGEVAHKVPLESSEFRCELSYTVTVNLTDQRQCLS